MSATRRAAILAQMRTNVAEREAEMRTWSKDQWSAYDAEHARRLSAIMSLRAISDELGEPY